MFPFVKMVEKHGGIPIYSKSFPNWSPNYIYVCKDHIYLAIRQGFSKIKEICKSVLLNFVIKRLFSSKVILARILICCIRQIWIRRIIGKEKSHLLAEKIW